MSSGISRNMLTFMFDEERNFGFLNLLGCNLQLIACKAEAFLKLHQLEDADSTMANIPKFDYCSPQTKFFGMVADAYVLYVQAQIEMALGR